MRVKSKDIRDVPTKRAALSNAQTHRGEESPFDETGIPEPHERNPRATSSVVTSLHDSFPSDVQLDAYTISELLDSSPLRTKTNRLFGTPAADITLNSRPDARGGGATTPRFGDDGPSAVMSQFQK